MTNHEAQKEGLAAHALGALDRDEVRSLEEHLATCAECRAELEEWRETAVALAYSAGVQEPSPSLRSRILESVREAGPQPARRSGETDANEKATASNVVAMPRGLRRAWTPAQIFGAVAATIAIVALSAALFVTWRRLNETERRLAQYETTLSQYETRVENLSREVNREREARELLSSPASQRAMLAGTNEAPGAQAQLAFDRNTGHAMLFAYNLPPAPAGKAYQLWFISDGKVMPGRVFTPDPTGRAVLEEQVPVKDLGRAPVFAVTLEPSGGVQTPTGAKYLLSAAS